ncbi:MAG: hypothetical protein M5T52_17615 [Ignavibacteriaceae bacterium]|nr:hypothetical protein [Ignavibacteriaceae bacterium]
MDQFRQIIIYIFIIGAAQGVQLAVVLFRKKENRLASKMLAITMLLFAIDLVVSVLFLTGDILKVPQLMGIGSTLPYVYGPNIFIYTLLLTRNEKIFKPVYSLNYIPFFLLHIYLWLILFLFAVTIILRKPISYQIQKPCILKMIGNFIPLSGIIYTYF